MRLSYQRVVEALPTVVKLSAENLPIKTSLALARLSSRLDEELRVFAKLRDKLIQDHQVKATHTDQADTLKFSCMSTAENEEATQKLREKLLEEFVKKFTELLETETEELIEQRILLPDSITITAQMLKPLIGVIEVG